jgi:hypothetical protein
MIFSSLRLHLVHDGTESVGKTAKKVREYPIFARMHSSEDLNGTVIPS